MKLQRQIAECLNLNITLNCYHDLCLFHQWLQEASNWASKDTHYQQLEEWWKPYNQCIHDNLNKYGFVNGVGAPNDDAKLWWLIYQVDPTWSPNLKTQVSRHHASAHERNEVMVVEIGYLCEHFKFNEKERRISE